MTLKVKRRDLGNEKIELQVTAPASQVNDAIRFANYHIALQNGVVAEGHTVDQLGKAIIAKVGLPYYQSSLDFSVAEFLAPFAVTQEKLQIIMNPQVAVGTQSVEANKDYSFGATVTLKPRYELSSYEPVQLKIPQATVSEEEIDAQLLMIAENYATWEKDEDRPLGSGDSVLFKIAGTDAEGNAIPFLTAERRQYTLGEEFLPEEFDEQIIGLRAGDEKSFSFTLPGFAPQPKEGAATEGAAGAASPASPADAAAAAAEPPAAAPADPERVDVTVNILERQKRIIPAVTDIWVQQNFPDCQTVPDLRAQVRAQGMAIREREVGNMTAYFAASELAKRFSGSIPDPFYEFTRSDLLAQIEMNMQQQGRTMQDFIEHEGGGQQQFAMQIMLQVRETLTQGFSLDALARHLDLQVEPADIEEVFHQMAPGQEAKARQEFELTGRMYLVFEGALRNKANIWLVDTAKIEYLNADGEVVGKNEAATKADEAAAAADAAAGTGAGAADTAANPGDDA
ncbi:MAG: hypothetical protein FWF30_05195 [Coriobacteriia bacterium]|nr:hypothetical protein [Coriobacteriia bacterium]